MLQIKNLSKTYFSRYHQQNVVALHNINLTIHDGEIFGVIGKSGAGKSTLLRCLNLLELPSKGQIIIDNLDLTNLPENKLREQRRNMGMIFQTFNLLESRSVFANIALPLELMGYRAKAVASKVQDLLDLVELSDKRDSYPKQLSGGQKQRVAIARALITNPKILLCDEPTSSLDPESTTTILQLLKKINHEFGITMVLITHEMDVIKNICDRVAILEQGHLVELGDVIDIFTSPQKDITKRLTRSALHLDLPTYIQTKLKAKSQANTNPIVQLAFIGGSVDEPVITTLIKRFNVTVNILQADLETVHNAALGFLICEFIGTREEINNALQYLQSLEIKTEVLGYV